MMKLLSLALVASALAATPALAAHRHHHHKRHHHHVAHVPMYFAAPGQPYRLSFGHNYGPGLIPGTYAYYDGPLSARCAQSAAAYRGQDGRAHPCN